MCGGVQMGKLPKLEPAQFVCETEVMPEVEGKQKQLPLMGVHSV